jgi:membrane fusion protein, copper/silver efflux system
MKKKYVLFVVVALIVAGLFYMLKPGSVRKTASPQKTIAESGHKDVPANNIADTENAGQTAQGEEAPTVEISVEKQRMLGVETSEVTVRPLSHVIRTVGRIDYDEKRIATVNTKIEGWIERLYVDYTGKYVKKGDPLADIYSPELVSTQQEFLNALKWTAQKNGAGSERLNEALSRDASVLLEATRERLRLWDISESQIDKIAGSGKPIRTLTLYSPVSGYVVQKMALKGMKVMPGEKLFDVADLSQVWVMADIYEYELPLIRIGQAATITMSYFPGKSFTSRIDYIYPTLSSETRTAKIRFSISNPGGGLKPQMFTDIELKVDLGKKLAVPDNAVIDTGIRQVVYVDTGDGSFEPREVKLGLRAEGFREVLQGLNPGEKVASSATFLVDSEAQLKGVMPLTGGHKH